MLITLPSQQTTIARLSQLHPIEKNGEMPLFGLQSVDFLAFKNATFIADLFYRVLVHCEQEGREINSIPSL